MISVVGDAWIPIVTTGEVGVPCSGTDGRELEKREGLL